jgi:protein phosphatase
MKLITIPELSLVALVGATGSGKSTFARRHFKPTEIISSDACRGLVSDDETDQAATGDAFDLVHFIARKRLAAGRLTVIDATNVQPQARKPIVALAREYHSLPVAIVLDLPERLCHERNRHRPERSFGPHVARQHVQALRRSLRHLRAEGFRHVFVLSSPEEIESVEIERQPLFCNLAHQHGPFDVIGDVHGCLAELRALLDRLGYLPAPENEEGDPVYRHPEGRKAVFVGDLVDRGPDTPGVLRLVMAMVAAGTALCLPGNHDIKLMRKLRGRNVEVAHGLRESLAQLAGESAEFRERVASFIDGRVSHYVLDGGRLVVAHAGMKESMQGRGSAAVRDFALYGETTGEMDEGGRPVRYNWAADYRGPAAVVYGHTPVPAPEWLNNTICIDTGCVFGGRLTALRYPEREPVSVPAGRTYWVPARPRPAPAVPPAALSAQQQQDELLDIDDVLGKRIIVTRLLPSVTIREENAIPALEVMSRFAVDPKWLIYLPPTMSPSETSRAPEWLEHPAEAFAYYRTRGAARVVCQEKHMGSRAVVVVCRNEDAARARFGVCGQGTGVVFTRTGRRFFADPRLESALLDRLAAALEACGLWDELATDWLCLDAELLPWSAKALELVKGQYAAVGAAGRAALHDAVAVLTATAARSQEASSLLERFRRREARLASYVEAYRRYCWPVGSLADLKLAPFHLMASASGVHVERDHVWHLETLARLCRVDPELLLATPFRVVDLAEAASLDAATAWWRELTDRGGEGMVVKPYDFAARDRRGPIQPALKVRGREYLRIIYGPEYDLPENLERLRTRGLSAKRSLALREFALGIEALERFSRREPLRRVHECVFGVLALESEPVDPRL